MAIAAVVQQRSEMRMRLSLGWRRSPSGQRSAGTSSRSYSKHTTIAFQEHTGPGTRFSSAQFRPEGNYYRTV